MILVLGTDHIPVDVSLVLTGTYLLGTVCVRVISRYRVGWHTARYLNIMKNILHNYKLMSYQTFVSSKTFVSALFSP